MNGFLSIKIDLCKAYDKVKIVFLGELLERLGFHSRWVDKMMSCVEMFRVIEEKMEKIVQDLKN